MIGTTSSGTLIVLFGMYLCYVRTPQRATLVLGVSAPDLAGMLAKFQRLRRRHRLTDSFPHDANSSPPPTRSRW